MPPSDDLALPERIAMEPRPIGLCADIGGSFIKSALVFADGTCGATARTATPGQDWPGFVDALRTACSAVPRSAPVSLSIAGIVDPADGRALSANVPCVTGRHLAAELGQALGRPVRVANDADCMVLAEALRGAGMRHAVVFGIVLGSGVGGGLVIDGRMVAGAGGIAGEWGHGPLLGTLAVGGRQIAPQPCGCGQSGCLDTLGGAHGMERLHRLLHDAGATSRAICDGWGSGDERADATVAAWLALVAGPLAVMVNATGAGIVPVAGGLGNNHPLIAALDRAVRDRMLRRSQAPVVVPSRFGDQAGLLGAALLLTRDPERAMPSHLP